MSAIPLEAFRESYRDLIAFVARRAGSRQAAQDIVHDAWLRVMEAAPAKAVAHPSPRAYLYTVAEHLVIDHLRRAARTAERFDMACTDAEPVAQDVADACSQREALAAVDSAIAALPERCRRIFLADRLDGLPQAEIAAVHGVSIKTVEREIQRAMDGVEAALLQWRGDAAALPRKGRRRALSSLLGLAGLGVGGALAWHAWSEKVPTWQIQLTTARGRQLKQPLPDGSTIDLDARTRLAVHYYGARRHVQLHAGVAFFSVARDEGRPFIVDAGMARIVVLGTRFEVALDEQGVLRVAVEEGRVRVQSLADAGNTRELSDLDALEWQPEQPWPKEASLQGDVAAWREGWLDFRHEPLGLVAQRLQRYCDVPIQVAGDAEHLSVFGRVRIADARNWLQLLPKSLPVEVRQEGDGAARRITIVRSKA